MKQTFEQYPKSNKHKKPDKENTELINCQNGEIFNEY